MKEGERDRVISVISALTNFKRTADWRIEHSGGESKFFFVFFQASRPAFYTPHSPPTLHFQADEEKRERREALGMSSVGWERGLVQSDYASQSGFKQAPLAPYRHPTWQAPKPWLMLCQIRLTKQSQCHHTCRHTQSHTLTHMHNTADTGTVPSTTSVGYMHDKAMYVLWENESMHATCTRVWGWYDSSGTHK